MVIVECRAFPDQGHPKKYEIYKEDAELRPMASGKGYVKFRCPCCGNGIPATAKGILIRGTEIFKTHTYDFTIMSEDAPFHHK